MRLLAYIFGFLLPWSLRRRWLRLTLGYRLHPTSRIGFSLLLPTVLTLGEHSRIGNLNVCRRIDALTLGPHAIIGSANWIAGTPSHDPTFYSHLPDRRADFVMGEHSALTNRHYVDCTAGVTIGHHSTVAGVGSQIFTHEIDIADSVQEARPLVIGAYSMVGTGTILLAGSRVPDHSVIGAGSVVATPLQAAYWLYAGAPARPVRELDPKSAYFKRIRGVVE
jgi:acetyltransferase-like isoleucine patch superfamily enzyme